MKSAIRLFVVLGAAAVLGARTNARSPVERVVNLLSDLKDKINHDAKVESQVYNKYACWCQKALDAKAAAIDQATADLRRYGQEIMKLKGAIATFVSEIEELSEDIKSNEKMQAEAATLRQKQNAAFMAEAAEMKQALAALQKAIVVLGDATKPAFLQAEGSRAVKVLLQVLPTRATYPSKKVSLLSEFAVRGASKYAPQSNTVTGILKDMYDTFSTELEGSTDREAVSNRDFEMLIAEKQDELATLKETKLSKEAAKAEAEERLAAVTSFYDETTEQVEADTKFFDETKAGCLAKAEAWTARKHARAEELEGVSKALEILSADSARELFGKSIKAGKETGMLEDETPDDTSVSFLQETNDAIRAPARAYAALKAQAPGSLRLAQLAVEVQQAKVGHFDKVINAIDAMVATLQEEGAADVEKRDQCKNEYQKIDKKVADLEWKIEKNEARIAKLSKLMELRTADKAKTVEDIATIQKQMAEMKHQRQDENAAFLQAKEDDTQAIALLTEARTALSKYYKTHGVDIGRIQGSAKGGFAQEPEFEVSEWQAPDADFAGKDSHKGQTKSIVSMTTMLIEDLGDEIKNGMKNEEAAQLQFEEAMTTAEQLEKELKEKKLSLEETIAKRGEQKAEEERVKDENADDLHLEQKYKAKITPDCDWILGAFEKRGSRRTAELNGLEQAKEYLAGAAVPE